MDCEKELKQIESDIAKLNRAVIFVDATSWFIINNLILSINYSYLFLLIKSYLSLNIV
jgi:hypothetical protein